MSSPRLKIKVNKAACFGLDPDVLIRWGTRAAPINTIHSVMDSRMPLVVEYRYWVNKVRIFLPKSDQTYFLKWRNAEVTKLRCSTPFYCVKYVPLLSTYFNNFHFWTFYFVKMRAQFLPSRHFTYSPRNAVSTKACTLYWIALFRFN